MLKPQYGMAALLAAVVCSPIILGGAGCASKSTVATRKEERPAAYAGLPESQKTLVDQGQIQVGMSQDAVYIAWGKPAQVLHSEDASGLKTTWLYQGETTDTYYHWQFYEVPRPKGGSFLSRTLVRDIDVRGYVSAELIFAEGRLESWRTLPQPAERTYYGPRF